MNTVNRLRPALALAALLLVPAAAQADRITAAYPELATTVAPDADSASGTSSAARPAARPSRFAADVDYQKMAIITEDALGRGYRIVWVNPPQKPKNKGGKSDR